MRKTVAHQPLPRRSESSLRDPRSQASCTTSSTASPVYTTTALSTAHSTPLAADSAGVLQPFYGDPAVTYRVTVRTSAGVLLYQDDNVPGSTLTAESVGLAINYRTTA